MKTVKEWFESVGDKEVRDFLLDRMEIPCYKCDSFIAAICSGLTWFESPEGGSFWDACFYSPDPIAYLRNHLDSLKNPPKRIQHHGKWYVLDEEEEIDVMEFDEYVFDEYVYAIDGKNELLAWKFKDSTKIDGFEFKLNNDVCSGNVDFLIGLRNDNIDDWDALSNDVYADKNQKAQIKKFCKWLVNKGLV